MANQGINYSAKINEMLNEMPDFITDFILTSARPKGSLPSSSIAATSAIFSASW